MTLMPHIESLIGWAIGHMEEIMSNREKVNG